MTLEKTTEGTKWIFRYLRADRAEIDRGPYTTQQEAQEVSDKMANFGAICTPAIEVSKDYRLSRGNIDYEMRKESLENLKTGDVVKYGENYLIVKEIKDGKIFGQIASSIGVNSVSIEDLARKKIKLARWDEH